MVRRRKVKVRRVRHLKVKQRRIRQVRHLKDKVEKDVCGVVKLDK